MQQVKQTPAGRISQRFEDFVDIQINRWSMEVHHRELTPLANDAMRDIDHDFF
jgi:hypothetical protein